jgi:hypothetical protein
VKLKIKTTDRAGKPVAANLALAAVDETVLALADDKSARIWRGCTSSPSSARPAADPIEEPNFYFSASRRRQRRWTRCSRRAATAASSGAREGRAQAGAGREQAGGCGDQGEQGAGSAGDGSREADGDGR